ncbi:hypothetical protein L6164_001430 [Bauhinia variegata]|uniref:Uncharacterized protein n=1 Tax=Bauhinia variegata TaxID=167791 RepID=A0ACB9Q9S1_BAUVA|nr:hypothetical protein L6164_001430 [Bauhinia variegata]
MSAQEVQTDQRLEAVPQSTSPQNLTIHVSDYIWWQLGRETENTKVAYVTFKASQGVDTALLLTGSRIVDLCVTISPAENYQLPPEALPMSPVKNQPAGGSAVKRTEDVVSTMLAKGYILGKDALNMAKSFDERHHLTTNASATVASIDHKMGLTDKLSIGTAMLNEKVRAMDEKYQVSEKTRSAYAVAEQKATSAGSAIMSNPYVSTGAQWVSNAFTAVAKAAEDVSVMTKEKVEQAEVEKKDLICSDKTKISDEFEKTSSSDEDSPKDPAVVPVKSDDPKDSAVVPVNSNDPKDPAVVPVKSDDPKDPAVVPVKSNNEHKL